MIQKKIWATKIGGDKASELLVEFENAESGFEVGLLIKAIVDSSTRRNNMAVYGYGVNNIYTHESGNDEFRLYPGDYIADHIGKMFYFSEPVQGKLLVFPILQHIVYIFIKS